MANHAELARTQLREIFIKNIFKKMAKTLDTFFCVKKYSTQEVLKKWRILTIYAKESPLIEKDDFFIEGR